MKKKTIIITGAAGFLGVHICEHLCKLGFYVIGLDINKKRIFRVKKVFKNLKYKNIDFFCLDITKEKNLIELKKTLKKKKIKIYSIINNAAVDAIPFSSPKKYKFQSVNQWNKELKVSIIGSFLMIKYFTNDMIKNKNGKIVFIGSDLSVITPNPQFYKGLFSNYVKPPSYSVIKNALVGMMKYYSVLFAREKICVNMLSPSPILNNQSKKFVERIKNVIPLNQISKKEDLNASIEYLLDDKNKFVTGQNILIDGGRSIV